jgi:3-phosphoshikimate 1-carboxyvinyltransferase
MKITGPSQSIRVKINLPSSKSISNRLLLIKALSGGVFPIANLSKARDTQILAQSLHLIESSLNNNETVTIDINDAGTPMRFLTAMLSITPGKWLLTGNPRMCERPLGLLVNALRSLAAQIDYSREEGFPPLLVEGGMLNGNEVTIDASVSSQFISALMLIAPVLPSGLSIRLTGKVSSAPYILMTAKLMEQAGVIVAQNKDTIQIKPQKYNATHFIVESDWSAAAFWYEIAALSKEAVIELPGLRNSGFQGDSKVMEIFARLGVKTQFTRDGVILSKSEIPVTDHFSFDFASCPDLVLPVAATCAGLKVNATLTGLSALRIKESDRLQALFTELNALGYNIVEMPGDTLQILTKKGSNTSPTNETVRTYNDHRMAMAFAPLAMLQSEISISDPEVVNKSYPDYWKHLSKAGFAMEF